MTGRHTLLIAMTMMLTGCAGFFDAGYGGTRSGTSSSLVDYLYPGGEIPPEVDGRIPHLELPLKVGIAFVPGSRGQLVVPEPTRIELLEYVADAFDERPYIARIEVIPETYLKRADGVTGMQQVARLYGVDVMALVSYDQVAATGENAASLLYWTIVGAYVIPGTSNEVQTFVDTAVLDVDTAKLLFRAPGTDTSTNVHAAVGNDRAVWRTRNESFTTAVADMRNNLETELVRFEDAIENQTAEATISYRAGYSGGGSFDGLLILILAAIAIGGFAMNPEGGQRRA